jgi:hypothetical protein
MQSATSTCDRSDTRTRLNLLERPRAALGYAASARFARKDAMKLPALVLTITLLALISPAAQQAVQPPPPTPGAFAAQPGLFKDVVVRIVSAGHYTGSLEFRRKQDVKRKAFN